MCLFKLKIYFSSIFITEYLFPFFSESEKSGSLTGVYPYFSLKKWDFTDNHRSIFLRLETLCRHSPSKIISLPKFLKREVVNIYPDLHAEVNI